MRKVRFVTMRLRGAVTAVLLAALGVGNLVGCSSGTADLAGMSVTSSGDAAAASGSPSAAQREAGPTPVTSTRQTLTRETLLPTAPSAYSAVGAFAADFPADLLPLPQGAEILVSSAVPVGNGTLREIGLNLRSRDAVASLMATIRSTLSTAGFQETHPAAVQPGLADESTFTRASGDEFLVVGVMDDGGWRVVTIGGQVRLPG